MASQFPLKWQAFRTWKQGNAADDYEDAGAGNLANGRFAIADGASEASFAGIWARLLVENFTTLPGKPWRDLDWVEPLRDQWKARVGDLPLPWYAEEKRELGAFATFLGLAIRQSAVQREGGYWRALAVGDCCLFHTRAGQLEQSFPMTRSEDFTNRPRLLGSRAHGSKDSSVGSERGYGRWRPGDRFFLMTDALAHWFLLRREQGHDPLNSIRGLLAEKSPDEAFAGWVEKRRQRSVLRNDDVTLIVVDVE
jgi:Protein phosphatase 2C